MMVVVDETVKIYIIYIYANAGLLEVQILCPRTRYGLGLCPLGKFRNFRTLVLVVPPEALYSVEFITAYIVLPPRMTIFSWVDFRGREAIRRSPTSKYIAVQGSIHSVSHCHLHVV